MSGVGKVPESVNKRSVTRLTQSSSSNEDSSVRDGNPIELVQVHDSQRRVHETHAEVLVQVPVNDAHDASEVNDGQGGGESSEGEGDVEIEHIGDEGMNQDMDGYGPSTHHPGSTIPVTFDVRKRTLIAMWQRSILEDLYKNGMTSASLQLGHLHATAAEKTGLDISVVKVSVRSACVKCQFFDQVDHNRYSPEINSHYYILSDLYTYF